MTEKLEKANILLVEDEKQIREFAADALSVIVSNVTLAENGQEGLDLYLESQKDGNRKFDLIVTDIRMPIFNGIKMIEQIRQIDQNIPIIVITADTDPYIGDETTRLNINGHIQKPMTMLHLVKTMADLL